MIQGPTLFGFQNVKHFKIESIRLTADYSGNHPVNTCPSIAFVSASLHFALSFSDVKPSWERRVRRGGERGRDR